MRRFVLASQSPRRRELLRYILPEFEMTVSDIDEGEVSGFGGDAVMGIARRKAEAAAGGYPDAVIIGADTVVCLDGAFIGKPADAADAKRILKSLSGRSHTVYTGVCVLDAATGESESFYEETRVTVGELSEAEIDRYIASGEPMDKVGAYGMQGGASVFVSRIEGDYFNVIGLPVYALYRRLRKFF